MLLPEGFSAGHSENSYPDKLKTYMSKPFFLTGSRSHDFEQAEAITNPLPPCPDSPNCVRISQKFRQAPDIVFDAAKSALQKMSPAVLKSPDDSMRIDSVFRVFIYKDDFVLQLEAAGKSSTLVHIRSSSRTGYSDLGVNRRRVEQFLRLLKNRL